MTGLTLQPLRDYIVVLPDESLSPTIFVPARNQQRESRRQIAHKGTVLACGPGDYPIADKRSGKRRPTFLPMDVRVGDRIRFGEWTYPEFDAKEGRVWLIQQGDVIGVVINDD